VNKAIVYCGAAGMYSCSLLPKLKIFLSLLGRDLILDQF